jgi:hypothetical protein
LLTETGSEVRRQLRGHLGRLRDAFVGAQTEEETADATPAYLQHKVKAPKTDREKLKKHEIIPEAVFKGSRDQEEQQA